MPLLAGLAAGWKMEEASGVRADVLGISNLTDVNTVTQAVGKIGFAGQFVAANLEHLSCADNANLSMGAGVRFTFAAWIWADTFVNGVIFGKYGDPSYEYLFDTIGAPGALRITIGGTTFTHGSTMTAAAWHLCIGIYDGTNAQTQVDNGAVTSTAHSTDAPDGTSPLHISHRGDAAGYWNGRIDEVYIWKRALTLGERTELWNGGAGLSFPFGTGGAPVSSFKNAIRIGL